MSEWLEYFKKTSANRNIFRHCIGKRRLIELIIEHSPKEGRILEAGCGTALLSLILADYGFEVTALDYKEEILEYAQSRVRFNNLKLSFLKGDIFNLSSAFEKKHFDVICHSGVMEHFSDADIIKSMSEQGAISKKVIFSVPNNHSARTPSHFGDERFLSNNKWEELLRAAGFAGIKVFGGDDLPNYPRLILPGLFYHRRFSFWWKWFSGHSIFICE